MSLVTETALNWVIAAVIVLAVIAFVWFVQHPR
jgi:hypothetical protein